MKRFFCGLIALLMLLSTLVSCDMFDGEGEDISEQGGANSEGQFGLCIFGHTEGEWVETPSTCTEAGKREKSCTVCGKVLDTQSLGNSFIEMSLSAYKNSLSSTTFKTHDTHEIRRDGKRCII